MKETTTNLLGISLLYKMFNKDDPDELNKFIEKYGMELELYELNELRRVFHALWYDKNEFGQFSNDPDVIKRIEKKFELKRIVDVFVYGRIYREPALRKEYLELF